MTNKNKTCLLPLLLLLLLPAVLSAQSFKKGYKKYAKKKDYPAAAAIFKKHLGDKYGAAARYYLVKMRLPETPDLAGLFALDSLLGESDTLFAALPLKTIKKQGKKYGFDRSAIGALRLALQKKALYYVETDNTIPVLDSLVDGLPHPVPAMAPAIDSVRTQIVNRYLDSKDYGILTSILNRHTRFVSPGHYARSRAAYDRIWRVFQVQYPLCKMDIFAADHPRSFAARDCWRPDVQAVICRENMAELLDFHAQTPWTSLEFSLINTMLDLRKKGKTGSLTPEQTKRLDDLRQISVLQDLFDTRADTAMILGRVTKYVTQYAPHFSAYLLMQEALEFFISRRAYSSAGAFLTEVRPYFPDTLPAGCSSNFDFQSRARPFIDGVVPLLKKPLENLVQSSVYNVNTPDGDESDPVLTPDGKNMYFAVSGRPDNKRPQAGKDVYVSVKQNGTWGVPAVVPALAGTGDQIPLSLNAAGDRMLVQADGRLFTSKRGSGGRWGAPEPLILNGLGAVGRAVFSADGRAIILEGADYEGGPLSEPDMDLFVSVQDSQGIWSTPAGLGASINTDKQEGAPFLTADGKALYYTSTGYPGLGKSDVFVSRRLDDSWTRWSRPVNLGKEINDTQQHAGFGHVTPECGSAFFTKYGKDDGKGDIWETGLPGG